MKKLILILACLFAAAGLSYAQGKAVTLRVNTRIYCDHCKECPSCGNQLEQALYAIKGVRRVDIHEKTMVIEVVYNPGKTDPDQIRRAITSVGYDADELAADSAAYGKLDDCCKK